MASSAFSEKSGETTTNLTYDYKNENGQAALPTIATSATTTAEFSGLNLNRVTSIDLSSATKLTTISPKTFAGNAKLTSVVLPASATKFEAEVTVTDKPTTGARVQQEIGYDYNTSSFASNNALSSITYVNFGSTPGTAISAVKSADWDANIKDNSTLWNAIVALMNSLGYDATLNSEANSTGLAGVKNSQNNNYLGEWPTANGTPTWYQTDIAKTDLIDTTDAATAKWFTNATDDFNGSATEKLEFGLTTESATSKPVYFKHNGVIWVWTQTLTVDSSDNSNNSVTITLTTHPSTTPNIYKGNKKTVGAEPSTESIAKPKDTCYTFKTWEKQPTTGGLTGDKLATANGVSFELTIAK